MNERHEGDRKGPHPTQPIPRLYYGYDAACRARSEERREWMMWKGGDPCGRLSAYISTIFLYCQKVSVREFRKRGNKYPVCKAL